MDFAKEIDRLIDRALEEDLGNGDITTAACVPEEMITSGTIVLKQSGVLAGLPFLLKIFQKIDPKIDVTLYVDEGSHQRAGTIVAKVSGPARGILSGERLALNFIQHASGVASRTAAYCKKTVGTKCQILDTRKTLPGLRSLEKYAVSIAGGVNHRFGLCDRFIIKSNHLTFFAGSTDHPIIEAVKRVRSVQPEIPIEVEITDESQLEEALQTDAESIMLDHMIPDRIKSCVKRSVSSGKKIYLEAAGSITLETVPAYIETGVDGISISDLTHSVQALDISMRPTA